MGEQTPQQPPGSPSIRRTLTRAASTFLFGGGGVRATRDASYWAPNGSPQGSPSLSRETRFSQATVPDSSSSEDDDSPWWLQDELWDADIPDYEPPSYEEATGSTSSSVRLDTPELGPTPKYEMNLSIHGHENGFAGSMSKPSPKPISKADYHGRGKGRGRSKVVRRMASKQTLLAKPGKSDEFDLDMGDLDAFGEGPIGRARGITAKGGQIKKRPPTTRPHIKINQKPYFIYTVSIIQVVMFVALIWEIAVFGGVLPFNQNPFFGPDAVTLIEFGGKWVPLIKAGQWWRFITPIHLHSGIGHLLFNLFSQVKIGADLERIHGTYRIFPIYMLCGIFGNLMSAIFLKQSVTVGASGAIFGFFGVLLVDLVKNWKKLPTPGRSLAGLVVGIIVSLAFGLLPGVDNWAHLGGMLFGVLAGMVFLPSMHLGRWNVKARLIQVFISLPLMLAAFIGCFVVFYSGASDGDFCPNCRFVTCLPFFAQCQTQTSTSAPVAPPA